MNLQFGTGKTGYVDYQTEHWQLVPEYIKELHRLGEHEAAERITKIALEESAPEHKEDSQ